MIFRTVNLRMVQLHEKVLYHVGNLAVDRAKDKDLDSFADLVLSRSESLLKELPEDQHKHPESEEFGSGEFLLYQKKIKDDYYEYYLTRIKLCKSNLH